MKRTALWVMAQGRKRYLYRRKHGGVFYIRIEHKGRQSPRSLGTTIEATAKVKAKAIIDAIYEKNDEFSRKHMQKSDYALLSDVAERYSENYGQDARTKRTAGRNVGALMKVVRLGGGLSWAVARANVLQGSLVRRFEQEEEKRIVRDARGNAEQNSELRVRTTITSTLRQARSIFKRSHMHWFDGLPLPSLDSFRAQGVRSPDRPKPERLDESVIEAMNADAPRLAREQPAVYAAFLLFAQAGLRNGEIVAARRSWLVRRGAGDGEIGIIYRPNEGFKPKKKTEGWVPLAGAVIDELLRISKGDSEDVADGYLVPAPTKTARMDVVNREHAKWAGQWIKDRSKVSYELRRYAGSQYYKQTRELAKVQKFLRHADLKTTMDWYWYLIEDLAPLETPAFLKVLAPADLRVLPKVVTMEVA